MRNNESAKPSGEQSFFSSLWEGFKDATGITKAQETFKEARAFTGKIGQMYDDVKEIVRLQTDNERLEKAIEADRKWIAQYEAEHGPIILDDDKNPKTDAKKEGQDNPAPKK